MLINHIINSLFSSCTYVIDMGADFVWLVDCGDVEPLLPVIGRKVVSGVLLTHAHFDHIYGLNGLLELFPNAMVYTNSAGREALLDDRKNLSRYHESPFTFRHPENIRQVDDGDAISLGQDLQAKVCATPGHNPACLSYAVDLALFTGDSLIPGLKTVTNLPNADKALAAESEQRLLRMAREQGLTVYPGHPAP